MKRIIALILCVSLLMAIGGCTDAPDTVPAKFYYRRAVTEFGGTNGIITFEYRQIPDPQADTEKLLSTYFSGPQEDSLISPFPRTSAVLNWSIGEDTLELTMNEDFGALTDVELSIACACICKTFTELLPVSQVRIQLKDGLLGGRKNILLSESDLLLYDNGLEQSRMEYTVYYANSQRRYLIAQDIHVNLATEDDVIACLIEAMMSPPENSGLYSALPRKTKLLDYTIEDGICTVNFSPEFERNVWTGCEAQRLTLLSVVNTLTQIEGIQQVEFASGGNLLVSYKNLTISDPFVFDENAIGPVRTGMNEFDATLYVSNGSEEALVPVPTRLRQTAGISQEELVIQALLDFRHMNSLYTLIPIETELISATVRDGTCLVDLSGEFLTGQGHLTRSIRSIVASLCALDGINSVQITVDGNTPTGDYAHLFEVLSPQSFWFL